MSKELPILFNGPMVRAVLDGRKTQTRRVVKPQPISLASSWAGAEFSVGGRDYSCPYGQPGDRLWVRETTEEDMIGSSSLARYTADGKMVCSESGGYHEWWYSRKTCPSIHMPRWASRITLEVTGVRVERLQDISEGDAKAEGLKAISKDGNLFKCGIPDRDGLPGNDDYGWHWGDWRVDPRKAFQRLWESINGPDSWDANPWVWVVDFRRIT